MMSHTAYCNIRIVGQSPGYMVPQGSCCSGEKNVFHLINLPFLEWKFNLYTRVEIGDLFVTHRVSNLVERRKRRTSIQGNSMRG